MQGDIEKARETMESIKCFDLEYLAVSRKTLVLGFAEAGQFPAALQEAEFIKDKADPRHYDGLLQVIAAVQAETGHIREAEEMMGDGLINTLKHDMARMPYSPVDIGLCPRLKYAVMAAWAVETTDGDLDAFCKEIGGIDRSLWSVKALTTFAKHLVKNRGM